MHEHEFMAFGAKQGGSLSRWLRMHFGGSEFAGSAFERSSGRSDHSGSCMLISRVFGRPQRAFRGPLDPAMVVPVGRSTDRESSLLPAWQGIQCAPDRLRCDLRPVPGLPLPGPQGRCYSRGNLISSPWCALEQTLGIRQAVQINFHATHPGRVHGGGAHHRCRHSRQSRESSNWH